MSTKKMMTKLGQAQIYIIQAKAVCQAEIHFPFPKKQY